MVTKREPARKTVVRTAPTKMKQEPSLWRRLAAIGDAVPDEDWAKLPRDLSKNFDHYAHGSPRQD